MKTGPLSLSNQLPPPKSSASISMRARIVVTIAFLLACGVGAWALIQNALRATTGHS